MRIITLLFCSLLLVGCATSPTGRSQLMLVSPESAIASSKEAYVETLKPLEQDGKIDNDPALAKRVRSITGRLIAQTIELYPHTGDWEWSVKVIDDPETVNAWCMAGGKMAIYTGLIQKVEPTDDELAQVMGHEISHAVANHTAEKMSVAMASQLGVIGATLGVAIATGSDKYSGVAMTGGAAAAAVAVTLPNSRTAETEADRLGIEIAARAGYDPHSAATLWEKMGKVGGDGPPQFLSTHPSPGNRQETLQKLAGQVMMYYDPQASHPVYQLPE